MEYRTVETRTLKGLEAAERLHTSGWTTIRVGLFSVQFARPSRDSKMRAANDDTQRRCADAPRCGCCA
jgi:hypothetical protein